MDPKWPSAAPHSRARFRTVLPAACVPWWKCTAWNFPRAPNPCQEPARVGPGAPRGKRRLQQNHASQRRIPRVRSVGCESWVMAAAGDEAFAMKGSSSVTKRQPSPLRHVLDSGFLRTPKSSRKTRATDLPLRIRGARTGACNASRIMTIP